MPARGRDWVVLRDSGRWDEFAWVWHDDGWMTATWFQGPYAEFIAVSRSGFSHGVNIAHFLGGFSCEVAGSRAIAQTTIYEKDRLDVVDPSASLTLDRSRLASFPVGYRYLGYVQEAQGQRVLRGLRGPEVQLLYREGRAGSPVLRHRAYRSAPGDTALKGPAGISGNRSRCPKVGRPC